MNKTLRKQVLKTIAAFLNSAGGTLLIGVEDEGNIYGIEADLSFTSGSVDKFSNLITTLITEYIGVEYAPNVQIDFENVDEEKVTKIIVEKAQSPVYMRGERGSEFWIRFGPTSRMLDSEETMNYISQNWN